VSTCLECKSRGKDVAARAGSLWCEKCDATRNRFAPVRRFGYYLAATDTEHGDPVLSKASRFLWRTLNEQGGRDFEKYPPARTDGVSIYTEDDGFEYVHLLGENVGRAHVVEEDGRKVSVPGNAPGPGGRMPVPFHQNADLIAAGLVPPGWVTV
jgi:hypothetical protein